MAELPHPFADQADLPRGYIDSIQRHPDNGWTLIGWAYDPGNPDDLLDVEVVYGTTIVAHGRTGVYREDLKAAGIGDGFGGLGIPLPDDVLDEDQEHSLHLRIAGTDMAISAPANIQKSRWVGHVDGIDGVIVKGWATDPVNPNNPLGIDIVIDGAFVDRVLADQPRHDLPEHYGGSFCGFQWVIPLELADGKAHKVTARIANTSTDLSGYATYHAAIPIVGEPLRASLTEIPTLLREERRYTAFIDEYYRASRLVIEAVTADAVIYSGHAAHEFAALLARCFARAYVGPLDRVLANPTDAADAKLTTLYVLHTDLDLFKSRCLGGTANHFFAERIRLKQPTALLVEAPDRAGGLERLDLDHARLWCEDVMQAARVQDMQAALKPTLIDFFFGHPGFILYFAPVSGGGPIFK